MIIDSSKKVSLLHSLLKKKVHSSPEGKNALLQGSPKDRAHISSVAKQFAMLDKYIQFVKESDSIREEKVALAKKNLDSYFKEDGSLKDSVIQKTIDKLASDL